MIRLAGRQTLTAGGWGGWGGAMKSRSFQLGMVTLGMETLCMVTLCMATLGMVTFFMATLGMVTLCMATLGMVALGMATLGRVTLGRATLTSVELCLLVFDDGGVRTVKLQTAVLSDSPEDSESEVDSRPVLNVGPLCVCSCLSASFGFLFVFLVFFCRT